MIAKNVCFCGQCLETSCAFSLCKYACFCLGGNYSVFLLQSKAYHPSTLLLCTEKRHMQLIHERSLKYLGCRMFCSSHVAFTETGCNCTTWLSVAMEVGHQLHVPVAGSKLGPPLCLLLVLRSDWEWETKQMFRGHFLRRNRLSIPSFLMSVIPSKCPPH